MCWEQRIVGRLDAGWLCRPLERAKPDVSWIKTGQKWWFSEYNALQVCVCVACVFQTLYEKVYLLLKFANRRANRRAEQQFVGKDSAGGGGGRGVEGKRRCSLAENRLVLKTASLGPGGIRHHCTPQFILQHTVFVWVCEGMFQCRGWEFKDKKNIFWAPSLAFSLSFCLSLPPSPPVTYSFYPPCLHSKLPPPARALRCVESNVLPKRNCQSKETFFLCLATELKRSSKSNCPKIQMEVQLHRYIVLRVHRFFYFSLKLVPNICVKAILKGFEDDLKWYDFFYCWGNRLHCYVMRNFGARWLIWSFRAACAEWFSHDSASTRC